MRLSLSARKSSNISSSESASIVTIVDNIEAAYRSVFEMMLDRVQSGSAEIEFNREFVKVNVLPDELKALSEMVFKGLVPDVVLFDRMRKAGLVKEDVTNDDMRDLIENSGLGLGVNVPTESS